MQNEPEFGRTGLGLEFQVGKTVGTVDFGYRGSNPSAIYRQPSKSSNCGGLPSPDGHSRSYASRASLAAWEPTFISAALIASTILCFILRYWW